MALQNAFGNLALDATLTGGNAVSNIWNAETSATGAITGSGQSVVLPVTKTGQVSIFVWGTHAGVNLTIEVSPDGTNWFAVSALNSGTGVVLAGGVTGVITSNLSASWQVADQAAASVRVRSTAWTSGSMSVALRGLSASGPSVIGGLVTLSSTTVDTELPPAVAFADALSAASSPPVQAGQILYNGSTWDRGRNNHNVTVDASSAKTVTAAGTPGTNHNFAGMTLAVNVTLVSGTTPTMSLKVQISHDGSTWADLAGAVLPSITGTGLYMLAIYPGVTPVANAAVSYPLPRIWRCYWTLGGTTPSFTFSTTASYVL